LTGLSGAGKSTIAAALDHELRNLRISCAVLDGDELRTGLNSDLGFSPEHRHENIRRIAYVARLLLVYARVVIVAAISPTRSGRALAKDVIGDGFFEVFVDAPISVCEARDPKGLYREVRAGKITNFTGVSASYEPPTAPALVLRTDALSVADEIKKLLILVADLLPIDSNGIPKNTERLHNLH